LNLIPAMDLLDNRAVRLEQGDYNKVTVYFEDPAALSLEFEKAGIKKIHLVDLSGARKGIPQHLSLFGEIKKKTGLVIEAGGGIRSFQDAERYFENGLVPGVDQVMIGSLPVKNKTEFGKVVAKYRESILLTVDVWGEDVRISGWAEDTGIDIISFMKQMRDQGIDHFLVTQIKRDGMLNGPDIDLYRKIDQNFRGISVTVSGGVSSMEDITGFPDLDTVSGIIIGKAFYEKKITLQQLQSYTISR